jgi:hypothetical protein
MSDHGKPEIASTMPSIAPKSPVDFFPQSKPTRSQLKSSIREKFGSITAFAKRINVSHSDLFHYLGGRRHKVGSYRRKLIKQSLIDERLVPPSKSRPNHECLICGKFIRLSPASKANSTHSTPAPSLEREPACDVDTLSTIGQAQIRNSNEPAQSQTVSKKSAA